MGLGLQPLSTSQNNQIRITGHVQRETKKLALKMAGVQELKSLTFKWPEITKSLHTRR